jgi:hypothetical protein
VNFGLNSSNDNGYVRVALVALLPGMCGSAVIATATACAIWTATSRVVRTDPTAALRVE